MATDTVPAAVPGPTDPPGSPTTNGPSPQGFLASMVAAVEPARPTFDLTPTTGTGQQPAAADGALDRSAPGTTSASFRDATEEAAKNGDPAGARHKRSIWKEMWLAAATRWAKGGGTTNKRLDLAKARAQAQAHPVKENRTTTVTKSGGLPVRNTGSSGAGIGKGGNKSGGSSGNSSGKGPQNSSGHRSNGSGRGVPSGGSGSNGSHSGGQSPKNNGSHKGGGSGKGSAGQHGGGSSDGTPKNTNGSGKGSKSGKGDGHSGAGNGSGKQSGSGGGSAGGNAGKQGSAGKNGKDGSSGKSGSGAGPGTKSSGGKHDLTKDSKGSKGNSKNGGSGSNGQPTSTKHAAEKTPLEKSRETGHKDGSAVRDVVDHVKAYVDGGVDGWRDKKAANAKEHDRLDKAHDKHAHKPGAKPSTNDGDTGQGAPKHIKASSQGQQVVIEDDNEPMEDPFMSRPTPIQAQGTDANKITLGGGFLKPSIKRSELRTFKDYEGRLEARIDGLARIADATKALADHAEKQAGECQKLADQARGVKGGDKLIAALNKLADQAKVQCTQAQEVHKRALRAHDFGKGVLSNIQTRYAPLYQAVVDSDEVKPAELKFYKDRGVTPSNTTLAA